MSANKYAGECVSCWRQVDAGEGLYVAGELSCSPLTARDGIKGIYYPMCDTRYAQELKLEPARLQRQTEIDEFHAQAKLEERERVATLEQQGLCLRCAGAGFRGAWVNTGQTCWDCGGTGKATKTNVTRN